MDRTEARAAADARRDEHNASSPGEVPVVFNLAGKLWNGRIARDFDNEPRPAAYDAPASRCEISAGGQFQIIGRGLDLGRAPGDKAGERAG